MTGRQRNGVQWWARTIAVVALVALPISAAAGMDTGSEGRVSVIVQERQGAGDGPELAVARLGGTVEREIELIHGFSAQVPASAIAALRATAGVRSVTEDRRVRLSTVTQEDATDDGSMDELDTWATVPGDVAGGWSPASEVGSLLETLRVTGAARFWRNGYTGQGVDVALIDSGVAPVEGVTRPGKLVYGPDLSFESQDAGLRHLDTFGHGTHMAGIIGGDDVGASSLPRVRDARNNFLGIAPGSRIVSLKVADRGGAADVSQVIAAIDWVVQHRNSDGLNIRVINLSFGTDGVQDYRVDPLAYAAEAAWRKGIVVVVAAGNAGFGSAKLNNPAYDPYVLAVGASDPKGTSSTVDDDVPTFSSSGDGTRNPDLVAPGKSIVSLRVPGSGIDVLNPLARVSQRFFRGSGTSQSAAVVSGAVALLLQQRPDLQPDQVKSILTASSVGIPNSGPKAQGAGALSLRRAYIWRTPSLESVTQRWEAATGIGSLDAARGSERLEKDGVTLDGERDIFGTSWDGRSWSADLWNGSSWSGGSWRGNSWTGSGWTGSSWSGSSWSGRSWSASAWTGSSWSGSSWSGSSWSGSSWSGSGWTGRSWSASAWTGSSWSGSSWSGTGWVSAG